MKKTNLLFKIIPFILICAFLLSSCQLVIPVEKPVTSQKTAENTGKVPASSGQSGSVGNTGDTADPKTTSKDPVNTGDTQNTGEGPEKTDDGPKKTEENPKKTEEGPKKTEEGPKKTEEGPKKTEEGPKKTEGGENTGNKEVVARAVIGSSGDILIHAKVRNSVYNPSTGKYAFDSIFSYIESYVKKRDYSVINFEFAVGAPGDYTSLPFKVPASVCEAVQKIGYDLALTANNHTNDGYQSGFFRTISTLKDLKMDFIGTRQNVSDKKYLIKDINGIKVGFFNFTYGSYNSDGTKNLNGVNCTTTTTPLVNMFSAARLADFYREAEEMIADMRSDGAEAIVLYIHWGEEYYIDPNQTQKAIAKKMCDLGVDVIIGGHPHKLQPVDVIRSTDGKSKTLCLYSTGNFLSNQVIAEMFPTDGCKIPDNQPGNHTRNCNDNGHTEDGILFDFELIKYSDGTVSVGTASAIPFWCMRYTDSSTYNGYAYKIIPLDKSVSSWKDSFKLTSNQESDAKKSYDRTMDIISAGMKKWNDTLSENVMTTSSTGDYPKTNEHQGGEDTPKNLELSFKADLSAYEKYMEPGTDEYLFVVDNSNRLTAKDKPTDLVDVVDTRKDGRDTQKMRLVAEKALEAFFIEMRANGFSDVSVTSAYRSYYTQEYLFNTSVDNWKKKINPDTGKNYTEAEAKLKAAEGTQLPGLSEHQTGLCCDMHNLPTAKQEFASQAAAVWMAENCWKFGFILRYLPDKEDITKIKFEPWHFRYVGRTHAKKIYELGVCLEEYMELIK